MSQNKFKKKLLRHKISFKALKGLSLKIFQLSKLVLLFFG